MGIFKFVFELNRCCMVGFSPGDMNRLLPGRHTPSECDSTSNLAYGLARQQCFCRMVYNSTVCIFMNLGLGKGEKQPLKLGLEDLSFGNYGVLLH